MMELLYTFLTIFVPIFITFLFFCRNENISIWFIIVISILKVIHLIIISLILSENFYKNNIIWTDNIYQLIHSLPINPIKIISKNDDDFILETFNNLIYTTKRTIVFNKKCLNNFFVKEDDCPITDIILENNQVNSNNNYKEVEINTNLYLYYTKNNKNEKLYFNNDLNLNIYELKNNIFNFSQYNKNEQLKEKEISNVIKNLKYYADFSDWICLSLFLISFVLSIINLRCFNGFHFVSLVVETTLFIFYLIRFFKFIDLKNVFIKYKDFILYQYEYNDSKKYFPNKYFNIDSFAASVQINAIFILILYTPVFEKCLIKNEFLDKYIDRGSYYIFSIIFNVVILITNIIYLVKMFDNSKN